MINNSMNNIRHYRDILLNKNNYSNIIEKRKIIFLHNPKCAGNSIYNALGIKTKTSHLYPSDLCTKKVWESFYSFVVVRNPFDRLISFFSYHTGNKYNGAYLRKYPKLKSYSLKEYFEIMRKNEFIIKPQINYISHKDSKKLVNSIIYFEDLNKGLDRLFKKLKIDFSVLAHLNKSKHKDYKLYFQDDDFVKKLNYYYAEDIDFFNYSSLEKYG